MSDKKISPREAALAVLKKAEELYKSSTLAKAEGSRKLKKEDLGAQINSNMGVNQGTPPPPPSPQVASSIAGAFKSEASLEKNYEGFKAVEASAAKSGASDPAAVAAAAGRKKYGKEAFQEAAAKGKKMGKSDESGANPDEKADAALGEKVEQEVQQHEAKNADPGHEMPMKGHIKLAKFMGRMEHKRGQKA